VSTPTRPSTRRARSLRGEQRRCSAAPRAELQVEDRRGRLRAVRRQLPALHRGDDAGVDGADTERGPRYGRAGDPAAGVEVHDELGDAAEAGVLVEGALVARAPGADLRAGVLIEGVAVEAGVGGQVRRIHL